MAGYFPNWFFATAHMPGQYWRPITVTPPVPDGGSASGVTRLRRVTIPLRTLDIRADDEDDVLLAVIRAFLQKVT